MSTVIRVIDRGLAAASLLCLPGAWGFLHEFKGFRLLDESQKVCKVEKECAMAMEALDGSLNERRKSGNDRPRQRTRFGDGGERLDLEEQVGCYAQSRLVAWVGAKGFAAHKSCKSETCGCCGC